MSSIALTLPALLIASVVAGRLAAAETSPADSRPPPADRALRVSADFTDADLARLPPRPNLTRPNLTQSNLTRLDLADSRVTGAGLIHLRALSRLKYLSLDRTEVDDAAIAQLAVLPELKSLSLNGTKLTDAALIHLAALPKLQTLSLDGTHITDAGLRYLRRQASLEWLYLNDTTVSDAGLTHLKELDYVGVPARSAVPEVRTAVEEAWFEQRPLRFTYRDADGVATTRRARVRKVVMDRSETRLVCDDLDKQAERVFLLHRI